MLVDVMNVHFCRLLQLPCDLMGWGTVQNLLLLLSYDTQAGIYFVQQSLYNTHHTSPIQ